MLLSGFPYTSFVIRHFIKYLCLYNQIVLPHLFWLSPSESWCHHFLYSLSLSVLKWSVCYTALPCTALHCTALHCTALHCTALHCTALHCTALHCTALHWTALPCTALHCTALHCTALHCTALLGKARGSKKFLGKYCPSVMIIGACILSTVSEEKLWYRESCYNEAQGSYAY